MLKRRGYNPQLSFAAFDNDEIVAFTLNGTGTFNGVLTAYDTGTGTIKQYRGQSIAGKIFTHSLPFLKESVSANTCWKSCKTTKKRLAFIAE